MYVEKGYNPFLQTTHLQNTILKDYRQTKWKILITECCYLSLLFKRDLKSLLQSEKLLIMLSIINFEGCQLQMHLQVENNYDLLG